MRRALLLLPVLLAVPATAQAGGIAVGLAPSAKHPAAGHAWKVRVVIEGCTAFREFGVDAARPQLVLRHVRSDRVLRVTLRPDGSLERPRDYPFVQRYVATTRLPRSGMWTGKIAVTRHRESSMGFGVIARA